VFLGIFRGKPTKVYKEVGGIVRNSLVSGRFSRKLKNNGGFL